MKNANLNIGLTVRQNELKSEIEMMENLFSGESMNNENFEYYNDLKSQLAMINNELVR